MLKINFFWELDYPERKNLEKRIHSHLNLIKKKQEIRNIQASVILVTNQKIKQLNSIYRKIDKATDVLSFNYSHIEKKSKKGKDKQIEGDVFIALNVAKAQARKDDIDLEEIVLKLIVHGLLHLKGLDHQNAKAAENMEKLTKSILHISLKQKG